MFSGKKVWCTLMSTSAKKSTLFSMTLVAVMSVFFLSAGGNAVNSVLQKLIEAFPHASPATIRLVSTLPNLMSMLVGFYVGAAVGKTVRYKTIFSIGIIAFVVGGVGPAFLRSSLAIILVFRGIFGISLGCFSCRNAYLLTTVERSQQARVIGWSQVFSNLGGAVLQMCSGTLADINWPMAFYPYFIGIISLILVTAFLKEPSVLSGADAPAAEAAVEKQRAAKGKLNPKVGIFVVIQFLVMITAMPVMSGMSTIVDGRNLGGATVVATILTVCQVGGIIVGATFGKFVAICKRFTMPAALFVQGLGIFLILIGENAVVIAIGATVSGMGTILVGSLNSTYAGQSTSKDTIPMATVLVMIAGQVAIFLSSYFIELCSVICGDMYSIDVEGAYLVGSIMYVVLVVLTAIFNVNPKPAATDAA